MQLETLRLLLRPWRTDDAPALYHLAKDERVGLVAGWPPHSSVAESERIIRSIFMQEGVFALTLKSSADLVGCIGITTGTAGNFPISESEGEVSYWLGVPYWGRELMSEAVRAIVRYGFCQRHLHTLWCGYFDGNLRSWRVQSKCGFRHHHTEPPRFFPLTQDTRVEHVSRLTRQEWLDAPASDR